MISAASLIKIGTLVKPHGIKGEITASVDYDLELTGLRAIVIEIDGIYVPFFITAERPKSADTVIVSIEDCDTDNEAKALCGKDFYALRDDVEIDDDPGAEGGYVSDFIGYKILDTDGRNIGVITDYDDSTENVLFIVSTPTGETMYIPVAGELIEAIGPDEKTITMSLPDGLTDLTH